MIVIRLLLLLAGLQTPGITHPVVVIVDQKNGWGQACLVGGTAYTVNHVLNKGGPFMWARGIRSGSVRVMLIDGKNDLVKLLLDDGGFPPPAVFAKSLPAFGEHLRILITNAAGDPIVVHTHVLFIEDGKLFLDGLAWPGMSGGCVVNDAGEVVSIVQGVMSRNDNPSFRSIVITMPIVKQ